MRRMRIQSMHGEHYDPLYFFSALIEGILIVVQKEWETCDNCPGGSQNWDSFLANMTEMCKDSFLHPEHDIRWRHAFGNHWTI